MTILKKILLSFIFFLLISVQAQTEKISEILNKQFKEEQNMYEEDDKMKPTLISPFVIENNVLSYEIMLEKTYSGKKAKIRREVALKDISELLKDINVIFVTTGKDAVETYTYFNEDGTLEAPEISKTNLFFTEINKERQNQHFRDALVKAFKKAGFEIESVVWFD